eukprot:TRINITY_DN2533_c0_g1_i1.p1 TRINITY_DN2533_c0_g1~~TRINITY_DN2533_c0_g1_i1.p1  ORF type:complete len:654 (+),score=165.41 TRINITY_DN2533_c0_g1_i1:92-2053(+)
MAAVQEPTQLYTKIFNVLDEIQNYPPPEGPIRINVNFKSQTFYIPCPPKENIAYVMGLTEKRYTAMFKTPCKVDKLVTESGADIDNTDLVQDALTQDRKLFAYGTVEEAQTADASEPFSISKRDVKDPETGLIVDTVMMITIESEELRDKLRYYINTDKMYDKRPKLEAEALLCYLPSFKTSSYVATFQPLINFLQKEYKEIQQKIDTMLAEGKINYNSLWSVFPSGTLIYTREEGHLVGAKIKTSQYNRSGWFPSFDVSALVIKSNGQTFYQSTESYSIPAFPGVKKLKDLPIRPMDDQTLEQLTQRGKKFSIIGLGSHYMNYKGNIEWKQWWTTNLIKADGRVMVDGISFSRFNPNYRSFATSPSSSSCLSHIPDELLFMTWPTIGGFSFTAKQWGEVIVENLTPITYDDTAFDKLVFPPEKKRVIKSLVENVTNEYFADVITGKGAGCIFLLHGSPGTGKTLTAEAIAELLHRPLYSVSVGELGTNTVELEDKLRAILELAGIWTAVILIDEADIFLEKRSENDIMRNAMVGIFLRLLEYHQGVLFLTTNRVRVFDEAFHSRISVALKYEDLDISAREKVWDHLLDSANIKGLNCKELAKYPLNGRQIRTTIRLAQSLALAEGVDVGAVHIQATVGVSNQFVEDLMSYGK